MLNSVGSNQSFKGGVEVLIKSGNLSEGIIHQRVSNLNLTPDTPLSSILNSLERSQGKGHILDKPLSDAIVSLIKPMVKDKIDPGMLKPGASPMRIENLGNNKFSVMSENTDEAALGFFINLDA